MKLNIVVSMIFYFAGICLMFKALYVFCFYRIILKRWSQCDGEIAESRVEYFRSKVDADTEGWRQKVIYTFKVDGVRFTNDTITKKVGVLHPSKSFAEGSSVSYKVGQKITVYYNKNNPKESIIDDSFNYTSLSLIIFGILSFFVANYVKNDL
jgi:hypothetical protein